MDYNLRIPLDKRHLFAEPLDILIAGSREETIAQVENIFKDYLKSDEEIIFYIVGDIVAKDLIVDGYSVKLQLWDFGGEERFRTFLPVYARGSSGGIFMYDTTRKVTLSNVKDWLSFFREHSSLNDEKVPILIVGGKKDLNHLKTVSIEDAIDLAMEYDLDDVMECSSKTGENVEQIFTSITRKLLKTYKF